MSVPKIAEPMWVQSQFSGDPTLSLQIPRPFRKPEGYPEKPTTIGEEIRKHRMDLGLYQKDVAGYLGVKTNTLLLWEKNRKHPYSTRLPRIVSFLDIASEEEFYLTVEHNHKSAS